MPGRGWDRVRRGALVVLSIGIAAGLAPRFAVGAELAVGIGSALSLGDGSLDAGCADVSVAGTLAAGRVGIDRVRDVDIASSGTLNGESATLNVSGDWINGGSFNAGAGTVSFEDGCGRTSATILGSSTFSTLSLTTTTGKLYRIQSCSTQTITHSILLMGAAGNLLTLRSTVAGAEAFIDLEAEGNQSADFVDVKDIHAIGQPIVLGENSVISGNATGWSIQIPVPALSLIAVGSLALAILLACQRGRATAPGAWAGYV